ncbi:MAG: hypothetical protein AM1032_000350 [Mycoplasmataceae bacterium]|nr:MAG: hypothetical protein AM1032_000350 [Mycoplasmataceae bacterium]
MKSKLQIEKEDLTILKNILSKYPYHFYAYGSRTKGTARKFSDLDLCYYDNLSWEEVGELREDLANSNLLLIVELVSWNKMRPAFQDNIKNDLLILS